jgi:hypothetical protein
MTDTNVSRLKRIPAVGKHSDHLGNGDTGAFNGEFSATAVWTGLKIFVLHSISIVSSRLKKSILALPPFPLLHQRQLKDVCFQATSRFGS